MIHLTHCRQALSCHQNHKSQGDQTIWRFSVCQLLTNEGIRRVLCFLVPVSVLLTVLMNEEMAWGQIVPSMTFTGSAIPGQGGKTLPILPGNGVQVGPLVLHPSFGFGLGYTDNVLRTKNNKESDFAYVMVPAIQALLPFSGGRHRLIADYQYTDVTFDKFVGNNGNYQNASGRLQLNFPGGLGVNFQGGYTSGFVPRGTALDTGSVDITKWNTNNFSGSVGMPGSWAGFQLNVQSVQIDFTNNNRGPAQNRRTNTANLNLSASITPKTRATISFGVTDRIYDVNTLQDAFSWRVNGGVQWSATGKTSGGFQAGYQVLRFDNGPVSPSQVAPGLGTGGNGNESFNFSGNITWRPTTRLTININPQRRIAQSLVVGSASSTFTSVSINANQVLASRTTLSGNYNLVRNQTEQPVTVGGITQERDDKTHRIGIGVNYQTLRWLGLRFQYNFLWRDSNFNQLDYYNNTMAFSIQGAF